VGRRVAARDAAYGCGLLVSRTRRHLLERHRARGLGSPSTTTVVLPTGQLERVLVRDRATLRHVTYHADYLNPARTTEPNQGRQEPADDSALRRAQALADPARHGGRCGGALFDEVIDRPPTRGDCSRTTRARGRRQVAAQHPRLPLAAAGPVDHGLADAANLHAREAIAAAGEAVVAATVVDGRHYLKFTLLNPETSLDDIAYVLDVLAEQAERFVSQEVTRVRAS